MNKILQDIFGIIQERAGYNAFYINGQYFTYLYLIP